MQQQAAVYQQGVQQRTQDFLSGLQRQSNDKIVRAIKDQQEVPVLHMMGEALSQAMYGKSQEEVMGDLLNKGWSKLGEGLQRTGQWVEGNMGGAISSGRDALGSLQNFFDTPRAEHASRLLGGIMSDDPEDHIGAQSLLNDDTYGSSTRNLVIRAAARGTSSNMGQEPSTLYFTPRENVSEEETSQPTQSVGTGGISSTSFSSLNEGAEEEEGTELESGMRLVEA